MTIRRINEDNLPQEALDDDDDGEPAALGNVPLVRALDRGLQLLLCFDAEHPEWSLSDISRHTGLHKATAFRFMKTLEAKGYIILNPASGKYALGPSVSQMAYTWISDAALARIAAPYLEQLSTLTSASVGLTVWNGDGALCVADSPTPRPFKMLLPVGHTFTDLANAHSKVLLAFGPESRLTRCLGRRLERLTPFTIVDPERLADELRRVAVEGVAYDVQGQKLGVCSVAVPVWDFSHEVRACMAIVVPEERFGPAEVARYIQHLKAVSAALSRALGYRGDHDVSPAGPAHEKPAGPRT